MVSNAVLYTSVFHSAQVSMVTQRRLSDSGPTIWVLAKQKDISSEVATLYTKKNVMYLQRVSDRLSHFMPRSLYGIMGARA